MGKNFLTILFIIVFISLYNFVFSSENSLIGVGIITALLMFKDVDLGLKRSQGAMTVMLLLLSSIIMPYFASFNPIMGFAVNAISLYSIVILTSERIDYKAYMGFVLIYVFANGTPVKGEVLILRAISILVFAVIITAIYYILHKDDKKHKHIYEVLEEKHIKNITFAVKLAFSLSLAMFLSDVLDIHKHIWFTITVMSLTQLQLNVTLTRIRYRLMYTLVGSLLYIVIFVHIIPDNMLIYFTLVMSYVYTFIKRYDIQMIFITISSLVANEIFFPNEMYSIYSRLILVALGALMSYIITKINFELLVRKLEALRERIENS